MKINWAIFSSGPSPPDGEGHSEPNAQASRRSNIVVNGLLVATCVWVAVRTLWLIVEAWPFTTDDAYITLRYARHLAEGEGLLWNLGHEPVEGYSNFLFVLIGAFALEATGEPILTFKLLCVGALGATCVLTYLLARRWVDRGAAIIPSLLLTGYSGTILWTVSGLETAFFQALALCSVYCFVVGCESAGIGVRTQDASPSSRLNSLAFAQSAAPWRAFCAAGLFACLASLTRPEGPLLPIVFALALTMVLVRRWITSSDDDSTPSPRQVFKALLALLLTFGIPYAAYFAWRWTYFGEFLPNTVYCKADYAGDPWVLLKGFWGHASLLVIASLLLPFKRFDIRYVVLLAIPAAYAIILFGADPIVAYGNRHFLTSYALITITAVAGSLTRLQQLLNRLPISSMVLSLLVMLGLTGWQASLAEDRAYLRSWAHHYAQRMEIRDALGSWLNEWVEPDEWIAIGDAGMVPYRLDAHVADVFCLNNPDYVIDGVKRPNRAYIEELLAEPPTAIIVHSGHPTQLRPRPEYGFYPALVSHPDFLANYLPVARFGAPGDDFHYWVFWSKSTTHRLPFEVEGDGN